MRIAYVLCNLLIPVFVVAGIALNETYNATTETPILEPSNQTTLLPEVTSVDRSNSSTISDNTTSSFNESLSEITVLNSTTPESNSTIEDISNGNSTDILGHELTTLDLNSTIEDQSTTEFSTANSTELTTDWNTTTTTTTPFPDLIVLENAKDPSAPPEFDKPVRSVDVENKLNQGEKIGIIVGCVMAVVVLGLIIGIYFLYRKYHSE